MLNLKIIIGSTRPGRAADHVMPWITGLAKQHPAFTVDVLDLRDWPLPFFAETIQTVGDPRDPSYSGPLVKRWNQRIAEGDAYLFGYSGGIAAGIRAIEHLAHIAIEAEMVPLRSTVLIPVAGAAFGQGGEPRDPEAAVAAGILLDDLVWWAAVLRRARADKPLPPAALRKMATAGNASH